MEKQLRSVHSAELEGRDEPIPNIQIDRLVNEQAAESRGSNWLEARVKAAKVAPGRLRRTISTHAKRNGRNAQEAADVVSGRRGCCEG